MSDYDRNKRSKQKYRKISPKIWNDRKFRDLSDNAKLVFFMLLTHPDTSAIGSIRAFLPGLACELGWSEKAFGEAFGEAFRKGMVKASEKDGLVWLPNFMKYNQPENPNVLKSWIGSFEDCPECELKVEIYQSIKAFAEGFGEAFAKAFREGFPFPLRNQEQEQEQEQKYNPPISPLEEKSKKKLSQSKPKLPTDDELNAHIDQYTPNTELRKVLKNWRFERKVSMKKPLSLQALKENLTKLNKLAKTDTEKIEIVKESIRSSWQSFFPLRKQNNEKVNVAELVEKKKAELEGKA